MDEAFDIYGDLEYDVFAPVAKKSKYDKTVFQDQDENLITENKALKEKIKQIEKANRTYASNISSLFLTAKNEVDKKNYIIKNLTEKLKQVTKSKSSLSKKETEVILVRCQEAYLESQSKVTLQEIKKSLRDVSPSKARKRKLVRFGNMSVYFFRDQGCFERKEVVDFPTGDASSTKNIK